MNLQLTITTTNTIENFNISEYLDLISTHVVVGTNIFSDFGASITDVFGGKSGTYQKKLAKMNEDAISQLRAKAIAINADAIVGLKLDFNEIAGKGKSMFMVSAVGTAVRLSK
ncbi:MAG: heavy metal-binding domain-containing protein [Bacteroidales bacterium]